MNIQEIMKELSSIKVNIGVAESKLKETKKELSSLEEDLKELGFTEFTEAEKSLKERELSLSKEMKLVRKGLDELQDLSEGLEV